MLLKVCITILSSLYTLRAGSDDVPGLAGLGCTTVGTTVYALGGFKKRDGQERNTDVYRLDLTTVGEKGWQRVPGLKIPHEAVYPSVLTVENTDNIWVLGGKDVLLENGFFEWDTKQLGSSSSSNSPFKTLSQPYVLRSPIKPTGVIYYPYGGGFVASGQPNRYLFMGGMFINNDHSIVRYSDFMLSYNARDNLWSNHSIQYGPRALFYTTHVYKGVVYTVGGEGLDSRPVSLKSLWKYNVQDNRPDFQITRNFEESEIGSRSNHSSVIVGNLLYVVGGSNGELVSNRVDILNMDTLTWSRKMVAGLEGKTQGCLSHYKDQLIYSFGFGDSIDSHNQVIDLKSWKVVKVVPPTPLSTILGITFGCLAGAFLVIGSAFYLYRRAKRIRATNEKRQLEYEEQLKAYNSQIDKEESDPYYKFNPESDEMDFLSTPGQIFLHPALNITSDGVSDVSNSLQPYNRHYSESYTHNIEAPKEWSPPKI